MKTQFVFYFEDEPQYSVISIREYVAFNLRCYRKKPEYKVQKTGPHKYRVTRNNTDAVAIYRGVA